MTKKEIKLVEFINLRYADPISSIDLTDNYLLFGSMLGSITFYIIDKKIINEQINDKMKLFDEKFENICYKRREKENKWRKIENE